MKQEQPLRSSEHSTSFNRINLYDLPPASLERTLTDVVQPPFRVKQIQNWLYEKGVSSFESMSNLPHSLRDELAQRFSIDFPAIQEQTAPAADGSQKTLFRLHDGSLIEAVYMPMGDRTTFCLSSQAGCAVGCTFCVTGFFGAGRNLTPSEMIAQYRALRLEHAVSAQQTNVVFMGMGEPLLNLENVLTTLEIMFREISPRRVTLSTSGIIPGIRELAERDLRPNLAVSINAPDRDRREQIMPITRKYPLDELMDTLREYPLERGRGITMEYVLLAGFNDAVDDARKLAHLIRGVRAKVNAIPFNPDPNLPAWMKRPDESAVDRFAAVLSGMNVPVTVRRSKGNDISAACGQLRGKTERNRPGTLSD